MAMLPTRCAMCEERRDLPCSSNSSNSSSSSRAPRDGSADLFSSVGLEDCASGLVVCELELVADMLVDVRAGLGAVCSVEG